MKAASNIIAAVIIILGVFTLSATPVTAETSAETHVEITADAETETVPEQTEAADSSAYTIVTGEVITFILAAILGALVALGFWLMFGK